MHGAMRHVVLLGDSVFDNGAYLRGGPDVVTQLREALPHGWRATLRAVDGATVPQIDAQLSRVPTDASHLVVSVGGNDALRHAYLLGRPATTVVDVLERLADAVEPFAAAYTAMLHRVLQHGRAVVVCTIYDGRLEPGVARAGRTAVALFDDAIQRAAGAAGVPVVELRDLCIADDDYANPIEPSVRGGAKIAAAIASVVTSRT
jgi:hypothetical protein